MSNWKTVAERMRIRRESLGLTMKEAAQAANISEPQWDVMENARRDTFRARSLRGVERALRWPRGGIDVLLTGGDIHEGPAGADLDAQPDDPEDEMTILARVRADLLAHDAWGRDRGWRLPALRRLYDLDRDDFTEWFIRDAAIDAVHVGHLAELRDSIIGIIDEVGDDYLEHQVAGELEEQPAAADSDDRPGDNVTQLRPSPDPEVEGP